MYVVAFDRVAFQIGSFDVYWYALAYVVGVLFAWGYARFIVSKRDWKISKSDVDDFVTWAMIGVLVGGRLGYVLFYNPMDYLKDPLSIFMLRTGGMSFHGALAGVVLATVLFARKRKVPLFRMGDLLALTVPFGLFLGRTANFINGELYGRPTDHPWGMIFPAGGYVPRHPSQLYEAASEGLFLFLILTFLMWFTKTSEKAGRLTGIFLLGYAACRSMVEQVREPDVQLGLFFDTFTMGQILSLPMVLFGLYLILRPAPHAS